MYLDTVNFEHLAVSQEAFLGHLAAAGIPEAHLELRRMQQEAAAAAQAAAEAQAGSAAADVAKAAAAGAAAAVARHEQQAAAGAADAADVLAGLQLADGDGNSGSVGLEPAQTSIPATPQGWGAAAAADDVMGREGSLPSLTPLGGAESPALLEAPASDAAAAGSGGGEQQQQRGRQQQRQRELEQGPAPRELTFEAEAAAAAASAAAAAAQQQHEAQAAAAAAVEAAARREPYTEPALIEEMVGEGTRHVLAAEAAGALQGRYPFMYARAEDLSLVGGWQRWEQCRARRRWHVGAGVAVTPAAAAGLACAGRAASLGVMRAAHMPVTCLPTSWPLPACPPCSPRWPPC